MKTIWTIYRADLRRAHRSLISGVIVLGLVVIPALFTWFNVSASWDPFANTKNLRIAIANEDTGYKSDLVPLHINIGDNVVSALRMNDQFDWVVDNETNAMEKTRSGEYYAAIVIPSDFSEHMLTFFEDNASSAPLTYYINEKKNGLSPKIAGQGAEQVSAQVNEVFARTIAEVALDTASSLSTALSDPSTMRSLEGIDQRLTTVSTRLNTAAQSADGYANLVSSAISLIDSASDVAANVSAAGRGLQNGASGVAGAAGGIASAAQSAAGALSNALDSSASSVETLSSSVAQVYSNADATVASASDTLRSHADLLDGQATQYDSIRTTLAALPGSPIPQASLDRLGSAADRLRALSQGLRDAASNLDTRVGQAQSQRNAVNSQITQAQAAIAGVRSDYDTSLRPQIEALASTIDSATSSLASVRDSINSAASVGTSQNGGVREGMTRLRDTFTDAATSLREAATNIDDLHSRLSDALSSDNLDQIRTIIGSNPEAVAAAIAAPVGVETHPVFPVANFGSQMAPLYTILALWVGSVLMIVSMRYDMTPGSEADGLAENDPLHRRLESGRIGLASGFLGRYMIFGTIALAQATLVCAGNLFFLGVQHAHPWRFMAVGWLSALVFSFLLYTFVATFGNAGKALGVLLLVLQISGAGGAFPLAIVPPFFSAISPFLPATHAMTALRASIAGYAGNEFSHSMWMLASFLVVAAILGLGLRPLLIRGNRRLVAKLESTGLM